MKSKWKAGFLLGAALVIVGISYNGAVASASASTATEVDLNDASIFPDEALRKQLKESTYDKNGDGKLSVDEIQEITSFYLDDDYKNISDFTGIGKLTALRTLDITRDDNVKSLDLSGCPELTSIAIRYCKSLGEVTLAQNTKLTSILLLDNAITELNIAGNTSLGYLNCSGNQLTTLDVSHNAELEILWCDNNQLTTLTLPNNGTLKDLDCHNNMLAALDLSACPGLETLNADENQLAEIDLSKNTKLTKVKVSYNQLATVNTAPSTTNLTTFYCYNNKITKLDLTENTNLSTFNASDNCLPALDLSKQTHVATSDYSGYGAKILEKQIYTVTPEEIDGSYLLRLKKDSNSAFDSSKVMENTISNSNATLTADGFVFDNESDIPLSFTYKYETNANGTSYPMTVTIMNPSAKTSVGITYNNTSVFNGSNPNPWSYTIGSGPVSLQPVEKEGAVFSKWVLWDYSGNPKDLPAVTELSDEVVMNALASGGKNYITLRAVFVPDVVEIQYDKVVREDGAIVSLGDSTFRSNNPSHIAFGEKLVLQDAARDGYTFEGWYTSPYFEEDCKITEFVETDEIYFTHRFLYAKWSKNASSDDNGQTTPGDSNASDGGNQTTPGDSGASDSGSQTTPENNGSTGNQGTTTPAAKGKKLTVANKKCQVKVTSSGKAIPTVTYVKTTDKNAKNVVIPDTVTVDGITYQVTRIADNAFKGNSKITKVTIGKNVTAIGKAAFYGCKKLKSITVTADNLKSIGKNAFKGINKKAAFKVNGTKKAKRALQKKLKLKTTGYVKTWKIK